MLGKQKNRTILCMSNIFCTFVAKLRILRRFEIFTPLKLLKH